MIDRLLCSDEEAIYRGFGGNECARRRQVLRETIAAFNNTSPGHYHQLAKTNLDRWQSQREMPTSDLKIHVYPGDWGEVTHSLTTKYGVCFAVLNMANAYIPGGAYVEGAIAQEENMFRRTDCHFQIDHNEIDQTTGHYHPEMTALLSAENGQVYLNARTPRVCIRGPEDRTKKDLGYDWLPDEQVFPFFELRASAQDLRNGSAFNPLDARKRVAAQLDTLYNHQIRHVVLGAFGCGAFQNPAHQVATIYQEEIGKRLLDFRVIAFAIFSAGYGPDNFTPFAKIFANSSCQFDS